MSEESLRDCFDQAFLEYGEKKALSFFRGAGIETEISYRHLDELSDRTANALINKGVKKGDRVVLLLDKSMHFIVAHLGIQKMGGISVPLNPGFKEAELSYFMGDADPALILAEARHRAKLRDLSPGIITVEVDTSQPIHEFDFLRSGGNEKVRVDLSSHDPALIIYTSGTTGQPKGAVLTQKNLVHDLKNIRYIWEITHRDVLCHALPLFHVHGLGFALHTCLTAGSHVLLLDAFSPEVVVNLLADREVEYPCSIFMAVPAMYGRLIEFLGDRHRDFGHIRLLTSGSAPLPVGEFNRIKAVFGKEPVEREGMSETGMNFSNPLKGHKKAGSIGLPLPGLDVRIVDPATSEDVRPGRVGEIWLKGPCITPGYWQKPMETSDTFSGGWFRTGDLGKVDGDGYYYLTDRIKHIIISGGENISPKEIENVINRFEGVVESSVVGIEDEKWGEKVVAAVVPRSSKSLDVGELQHFCREQLHDWKCPKEIVLVDHLPRNTMGKVLHEEVKQFFGR
ncbi:MAG: AMP-binding protein [Pseudomonadota bacterium]